VSPSHTHREIHRERKVPNTKDEWLHGNSKSISLYFSYHAVVATKRIWTRTEKLLKKTVDR
jgi:hypothetical protein